jgi:hypothetical protein
MDDICGYCGKPGADKIPCQLRWPGEKDPGTELVHAECEAGESFRAQAELTPVQRENFLNLVIRNSGEKDED